MNLAYDIANTLPELRREADARMTEIVRAGTYTDGTDEDTGDQTRVIVEVLYEGPARVRYSANAVRGDDRVGQVFASQDITVSIPTAAQTRIPDGAAIEVLASTVDPVLVGRVYTVDGAPAMGQTTAHRYPVTELS